MKHPQNGKPLRKRLQRQLEFYLSASNLRQDKFLQQHMDADGFLAIDLFLSFRKCVVDGACNPTLSILTHDRFFSVGSSSSRPRSAWCWMQLSSPMRSARTSSRCASRRRRCPVWKTTAKSQVVRPCVPFIWILGLTTTIRLCDWSAERTIYIEAFSVEHDHDSLRQLLARFGKVGYATRLHVGWMAVINC